MTGRRRCALIGDWRIVEYGRRVIFFTWAGFEEMDEVNGSGSAEMQDDGSIEIEFAYHLRDEPTLKAVPA